MGKKGLSFDEKRKRLLELMMDSKDVFNKKEIEKRGNKEKGITTQSVMEVLQSLIDDGLVDFDKIGSGNFYWALPSRALHALQTKREQFEEQKASYEESLEEASSKKRKLEDERDEGDERAAKLQKLEEVEAQLEEVNAKLSKYRDSDPEVVEEKKKRIHDAVAACNRWTDNIFQVLSDIKSKRPDLQEEDILKNFQLPAEMDYIDDPK